MRNDAAHARVFGSMPSAARGRSRREMPSHLLDHLNAVWLVVLFLGLGLAPGTLLTSALRVPRYFWTPLVMVSASLIGYAMFWAYFYSPTSARLLSWAVVSVSAVAFAAVLTSKPRRERDPATLARQYSPNSSSLIGVRATPTSATSAGSAP